MVGLAQVGVRQGVRKMLLLDMRSKGLRHSESLCFIEAMSSAGCTARSTSRMEGVLAGSNYAFPGSRWF